MEQVRTHIDNEAFAVALSLKPQTLRAAVCRHGHYFGFVPGKMPNGRLIWRIEDRDALLRGETGPLLRDEPLAA